MVENLLDSNLYYNFKGIQIYHGDCLEILPLLSSVDLIITDPPYGIDFQSSRRIERCRLPKIKGDTGIDGRFIEVCFEKLKDTGSFYLFTRWDVYPEWLSLLPKNARIRNCIIWDRVVHGMGDLKNTYAPTYDMILFAIKGKHNLRGKRPKDVIRSKRVDPEKLLHPAQKPIDVIYQLIQSSSDKGDIVLDPFMGSGTTLRAAKDLGRNAIGIEIEKKYCEIAIKRLQQEVIVF